VAAYLACGLSPSVSCHPTQSQHQGQHHRLQQQQHRSHTSVFAWNCAQGVHMLMVLVICTCETPRTVWKRRHGVTCQVRPAVVDFQNLNGLCWTFHDVGSTPQTRATVEAAACYTAWDTHSARSHNDISILGLPQPPVPHLTNQSALVVGGCCCCRCLWARPCLRAAAASPGLQQQYIPQQAAAQNTIVSCLSIT
jgi:hypothetical protein